MNAQSPPPKEFSKRFTADEWNGRRPAYASGGPLSIPPSAPITLTEALVRRAGEVNRGIIYVQKDQEADFQSYADLLREARQILTGLRSLGMKPRARVILQIDNLRNHFTTFWACVLGGFTPVTVAVAPSYKEKNGVVNKLFNTWKLLKEPLVITSNHLESAIQGLRGFLPMEGLQTAAVEPLKQNPEAEDIYSSRPEDLVFFQLTSGSTGIPKCIQETHRGIIHHIHGAQQFNEYTAEDVTLNWLPVDHVVPILTSHLKDVYVGCQQVHVKTDIVLAEPLRWLDLMEKHRVTHSWSPNFGFKLVSDRLAQVTDRRWNLKSVKFLMNAGEQVTLPVVSDFLKRTAPFGIRSQAMQPAFGMAEVCTCMTYQNEFTPETGVYRIKKSTVSGLMQLAEENDPAAVTFVDLGPPVPGVEIRITDKENMVLPEGVVGRFQIRGAVVTPGYLYNDAANAEAFVGDGWFNSGDLGFIWNGRLTLTGREKEMIIVRGANFYCYEIEDVVNSIEGVEPTFVGSCAVADSTTGTEGLAIFFVPKAGFGFTPAGEASPELLTLIRQIKTQVAANLGINPMHVVPLEKSSFPKTTSGKIQRSQMKKNFEAGDYTAVLERLKPLAPLRGKEATRDSIEERLVQIWRELFQGVEIGVEDNFFELGGDSLLAARVLSRVRDAFQVEVPINVLFNGGGTIQGMATHIRNGKSSAGEIALQKRADLNRAPASPGQQRLWLLDQLNPGCPAYNVCTILQLSGALNTGALGEALNMLAERHEALRARFELAPDGVWQVFASELPWPLEVERVDRAVMAEELKKRAENEAAIPFDLRHGPLIRARLLILSPEESYLIVTFHQTVIDSWSLGIFYHELAQLYQSLSKEGSNPLPQPALQFGDYTAWQRSVSSAAVQNEHLRYWQQELKNTIPEVRLPFDLPHPKVPTLLGETQEEKLGTELSAALRARCKERGATVFMGVLGSFQAFLSLLTGQKDFCVGTAISARNRVELESVIGFFANSVPMRAVVGENTTFFQLLDATKERTLGAYVHQFAPLEKLVEEFHPSRNSTRPPLFQVWCGAWDPLPSFSGPSLSIRPLKIFMPGAQFELSLFVIDAPEGISLIWEYRTELFVESTIKEYRKRFTEFLQKICDSPETPLQILGGEIGLSSPKASSRPLLRSRQMKNASSTANAESASN